MGLALRANLRAPGAHSESITRRLVTKSGYGKVNDSYGREVGNAPTSVTNRPTKRALTLLLLAEALVDSGQHVVHAFVSHRLKAPGNVPRVR